MEVLIPIACIVLILGFFGIYGKRLFVWSAKEDAAWSKYEIEETIRRQQYQDNHK